MLHAPPPAHSGASSTRRPGGGWPPSTRTAWPSGWGCRWTATSWPCWGRCKDATVAYGDELLAPVLAAAGEDALVVVTADHGQQLGEHGLVGHFFSVYQPLARVPLVVRHPAPPRGLVERPVQRQTTCNSHVLEAAGASTPASRRR